METHLYDIHLEARIKDYIDLSFQILFLVILFFQLPFLLILLLYFNYIEIK